MKKDEFRMIAEMKKMQSKLDESILKEHQCEYSLENTRLALIDELGETNHENKANWCWWKYTQKPVDKEKLLEELSDSWHFALSIDNNENGHILMSEHLFSAEMNKYENFCLSIQMSYVVTKYENVLPIMACITQKLEFTIEDVYKEYLRKNKINFERLASGY